MSKKGKTVSFSKMLKENEKKILVTVKGEEMKLSAATSASVDGIICTSLDSVVPVSVSEAAENSVPGVKKVSVQTSYAQTAWSLYENALKSGDIKQTMLIMTPESDIDDVLSGDYADLEPLYGRTNIQMIMDAIPEKLVKRITKWHNAEKKMDLDMFIVKIPNVILFTDSIKKNVPCSTKVFDLVFCFVRTPKSLKKLAKKDVEKFDEAVEFSVARTISVLKDFGSSCVHTTIDDRFMIDPHDYAEVWAKNLIAESEKGIISNFTFCTTDTDTLVSFNNQITNEFLKDTLKD